MLESIAKELSKTAKKPKNSQLIKFVEKQEFVHLLNEKGIKLNHISNKEIIEFYKNLETKTNLIKKYVLSEILNMNIGYPEIKEKLGKEGIGKKITENKYGKHIRGKIIREYIREGMYINTINQAVTNLTDMNEHYKDLTDSFDPIYNSIIHGKNQFFKAIKKYISNSENEEKQNQRVEDVEKLADFYCDVNSIEKRKTFDNQLETEINNAIKKINNQREQPIFSFYN
jgi:nucleoside diphosphate kinase